jgi:hypothetical protein
MKASRTIFGLTLILIFAFASLAIAEEKAEDSKAGDKDYIPMISTFYFDVRALTVFDMTGTGLERDEDPKDELGIGSGFGGLGSGVGVKLGYLINGHHDVGGHLQYRNATVQTYFNPEDEKADEVETRTESGNLRMAAYYNYNWNVKGWVMPYVGPVLGFDVQYSQFRDLDDDDEEIKTGMVTPFVGVEGGVKLFPMKNVAFDISMISSAGPTVYVNRYGDDREDDDYYGASFNLALNAGLCVYFD